MSYTLSQTRTAAKQEGNRSARSRPRTAGGDANNRSGVDRRRPASAGGVNLTFSQLETILAPRPANRTAVRGPNVSSSFDLALRNNREFDAIDPKVIAFNKSQVNKALQETVQHRIKLDRSHRSDVRERRDMQRDRFNTLAYSRFIAAVR
jgi:hypothetical protein